MANTQGNQGGNHGGGFGAMDPARQKEIASQGGKAAHQSGNAHEFNAQEAAEAGSKSHGGGGSGGSGGGTRGGSSEQHAEAGRQSHKNR